MLEGFWYNSIIGTVEELALFDGNATRHFVRRVDHAGDSNGYGQDKTCHAPNIGTLYIIDNKKMNLCNEIFHSSLPKSEVLN